MRSGPLAHRGFADFARERGLQEGERRSDGAFVLVCDGRVRVHVQPAAQGAVVLDSRLAGVPAQPARAATLLEQALRHAGQWMGTSCAAIVLAPDESELRLQWHIGAEEDGADVAWAVEQFLNTLGETRRMLGEL